MYKPGESGNPNGRPRGVPNKNTLKIRNAFQLLLEAKADELKALIDRIEKDDPARALELMLKFAEYVTPKLARTEMTGADGKDLFQDIKFEFKTAKEKDGKENEGTSEESDKESE